MNVFGLTGGIGMGKSAAEQLLCERGVPVIDTDVIARQIVEPGRPALAEIKKLFGEEIVSSDGQLRRDELAHRVFSDATARKRLEAVLHPRIKQIWLAQVEAWHAEGRGVAVVIVPLLFETDAAPHFDRTICLACSADTQRLRLLARNWTPEQIEQRIRAQWPIENKMAVAHHVIWTEGSLEVLAEQLDRIVA